MKVKYMRNKIKNIIVSSLILCSCLPDTETTSSSSSTTSVSSSSGSNSQSETTVEQQVTTSGNPPVTETSDTDEFDTIIMTISADSNCGDGLIEFPEECDDGNTIAEDFCDDSCFKTRFVFRSFESIPSNFGGTFFCRRSLRNECKTCKIGW